MDCLGSSRVDTDFGEELRTVNATDLDALLAADIWDASRARFAFIGNHRPSEYFRRMTPEQCRAARAWLNWSQDVLAKAASVGVSTVRDFEAGRREPTRNNLAAMQVALETEGVSFVADNDLRGIMAPLQPWTIPRGGGLRPRTRTPRPSIRGVLGTDPLPVAHSGTPFRGIARHRIGAFSNTTLPYILQMGIRQKNGRPGTTIRL